MIYVIKGWFHDVVMCVRVCKWRVYVRVSTMNIN